MANRHLDMTQEPWQTDGCASVYCIKDGTHVRLLLADRNTRGTSPVERDANVFMASHTKLMFDTLVSMESALFYATTEGRFDSIETRMQVLQAHNEVKALLQIIAR